MRAPHLPTLAGSLILPLLLAIPALAQPRSGEWDLLIKGGHVIDARNGVDGVDIAIKEGKIARFARIYPPPKPHVVNATGLYVTGIIDIRAHVTRAPACAPLGDLSVYPNGFSYRTGVTTLVDAGTAGWRNFADFRQRVIDRANTRVLAFVNIVAEGMSPHGENDPKDMQPEQAARVAKENADVVVGFKTAHYAGPAWHSIDTAVEAGRLTNLPVMVDFGFLAGERTLKELLETKLRAGDIYTHCYSPFRTELLPDGTLNPAMRNGRKRGVLFDVGHGGGSFFWNIAVPATQQGFWPDTISTDLHIGSMNRGMKDLSNVMSKLLVLGMPLKEVIAASTWRAAQTIKHPELGHLSEGATADVAVFRMEQGAFGFLDSAGARMDGKQRLRAELTIQGGNVMWDLNGIAAGHWKEFDYKPRVEPTKPVSPKESYP
ncbi:MAG: amidohydrolase/deacetylase family metallohydrolase [Bryobacterales bacterium]|nr:amidohydrolase/deacetylase family metallohydrolase [Bryobacterales bacterium]